LVTAVAGQAPICGGALKAADRPWIVVGGVARKLKRWPKHGSYGEVRCQRCAPGHAESLPVGVAVRGGPVGWCQRAKVSMTIM
jgi:hypothetical protein